MGENMLYDNGFIKLHRKILNWQWYEDTNVFRLFTHLLFTANWEDKKWLNILIKRGQLVTSLEGLSGQTGLTVKQIRTALDKLKMTNEITTKTTNRYTLVTIEKYSDYQDVPTEKGKQDNQQKDKQKTNKGQTDGKQRATTKEYKEYKERKEYIYCSNFESFYQLYPKKVSKEKTKLWFIKNKPNDQLFEKIIQSLKNNIENNMQWKKDNGQYIPHPTTWLNQKRWEDEINIESSFDEIRKQCEEDDKREGRL
jgi:hypothetical protein